MSQTTATGTAPTKPRAFIAPDKDPDSEPWWRALEEERLLVLRCEACARASFPLAPSCAHCGSTSVAPELASGEGVVYSWVEVHRALDPAFSDGVPYTVVAVDLAEGPRMFGRLFEATPAEAPIGTAVVFENYRVDGQVLPGFVVRGDA